MFLVDQASVSSRIQNNKISNSTLSVLIFSRFHFHWVLSQMIYLSLTFTFNCNFSINIVVFYDLFSLKMSDEG